MLQAELEQALPAAGNAGSLQSSPVVQDLRQLCEQVETLKAEREATENELKNAQFDMCELLLVLVGKIVCWVGRGGSGGGGGGGGEERG